MLSVLSHARFYKLRVMWRIWPLRGVWGGGHTNKPVFITVVYFRNVELRLMRLFIHLLSWVQLIPVDVHLLNTVDISYLIFLLTLNVTEVWSWEDYDWKTAIDFIHYAYFNQWFLQRNSWTEDMCVSSYAILSNEPKQWLPLTAFLAF